jgi:hypothetical protein
MATAVHAATPLSSTASTSPSSSVAVSPRKFALAQVHSDVCLVQGTVPLPLLSAALFPNAFSLVLPPAPRARSVPLPCPCVLPHQPSLLLARTRKLPLGTQRDRSAHLCSRIHHHLPVLPPRRASPVGHPDSRVARRAERVGRGGQRHCLPRSRCHGTSPTTHGSPVVYRGAAEPFFPRRKTDGMIVSIVSRPSRFSMSESNVVPNCTCIASTHVA